MFKGNYFFKYNKLDENLGFYKVKDILGFRIVLIFIIELVVQR